MARTYSHYDLLGVSPLATTEEIKRAFRRTHMEFHPDHAQEGEDKAFRDNIAVRLNHAWAVLRDPEQRAAYDAEIGLTGRRLRLPSWRFHLEISLHGLTRPRPGRLLRRISRPNLGINGRLADTAGQIGDLLWATRIGQWLTLIVAGLVIHVMAGRLNVGAGLPEVVALALVGLVLARAGDPTPVTDARILAWATVRAVTRLTFAAVRGTAELVVRTVAASVEGRESDGAETSARSRSADPEPRPNVANRR